MSEWTNEPPSEPGYYWIRWVRRADGRISDARIAQRVDASETGYTTDYRDISDRSVRQALLDECRYWVEFGTIDRMTWTANDENVPQFWPQRIEPPGG